MTQDLEIRAAQATSLSSGLLDDDGGPMVWTRRRWARMAAQIAVGRSYEIRAHGELLAIGGFVDDAPGVLAGLKTRQAWFFAAKRARHPGMLRKMLDGVGALLDVESAGVDCLTCLTHDDHPRARRLVTHLGFEPTALNRADGLRVWFLDTQDDRERST